MFRTFDTIQEAGLVEASSRMLESVGVFVVMDLNWRRLSIAVAVAVTYIYRSSFVIILEIVRHNCWSYDYLSNVGITAYADACLSVYPAVTVRSWAL